MALLAAVTLVPNDYFAINTSAAVFAKLNMPVVDLPELSALVGLNVQGRPGGAISLGRRYGPRLCKYRRGAAAHDEVLVPVHHHVRGPLHPHDDRRGDPSGPLPPPGPPGLRLGADQEDRLDARCYRNECRRLLRMGLYPLHRGHLLDLAHVWRDEPDAGRAGPGHWDDDHPPDRRGRRYTPWSRWCPASSCLSLPSWQAL